MIGKIILLCVLIVSIIFTVTSLNSAVSQKMSIIMSLIPIAFTLLLAVGLLLVFLGI